MTLYEELGVPPEASPDTIREAYRNVARLLHPDAQTDPALKESAEGQMKRINQVYETLSDPERRRRYDLGLLKRAEHPGPIFLQAAVGRNRAGNIVWLISAVVCAGSFVWVASRESSPVPAAYPVAVPAPSGPAAAVGKKVGEKRRVDEVAALRKELSALYAERDRLRRRVAELEGEPGLPRAQSGPSVPVPAPSFALPPPVTPVPAKQTVGSRQPEAHKGWAGAWVYRGSGSDNKNRALFPPEFIETVIDENRGWIRGQYRGRFKVADPKIAGDVSFIFEGRAPAREARLNWAGIDGASGEVRLKLISESSLEVDWTANSLGKSLALASGTAILERKR